jgi:DNA sulfur modification protein DndD
MKINKVDIKNFRQFLDTSLDFETKSQSKIHLVVGTNRAGKTTFLSAVYLALYGQVLDSMKTSEICNINEFNALAENENTSTAITIEFSHGGSDYYLRRFIKIRKVNAREERFDEQLLLKNLTSGEQVPTPQRWINRRFPPNLAKFLLFPGEVLDGFFNTAKFDSLSRDIKALAGLDKFELLENAANGAKKQIGDHLRNIPNDAEIGRLIAKIEGRENKIKEVETSLATHESEIANLQTELRTCRSSLSEHLAQSQALQELEASENAVEDFRRQLTHIEETLTLFITEFGWVAFTKPLASKAQARISKLEAAGDLGAQWPPHLIEHILENGECVCGSNVRENVSSQTRLKKLANQESKLRNPTNYLIVRDSLSSGALSFEQASQKYKGIILEQRRLQEELDSAQRIYETKRANLNSSGDDAWLSRIVNRANDLSEIVIPRVEEELAKSRGELAGLRSELDGLNKTLNESSIKNANHGSLMRQRQSLENVMAAIRLRESNAKDLLRRRLRDELQSRLTVVYPQELIVEVTSKFEISVKQHGRLLNEAGGETQLQSIITAVVLHNIAKEFSLDGLSEGSSADFPLVIDAAFNKMGPTMTKQALDVLGESTSQVILLLLEDQAKAPLDFLGTKGLATLQILLIHQVGQGADIVWSNSSLDVGDPILKTFNAKVQRTEGVTIERA